MDSLHGCAGRTTTLWFTITHLATPRLVGQRTDGVTYTCHLLVPYRTFGRAVHANCGFALVAFLVLRIQLPNLTLRLRCL